MPGICGFYDVRPQADAACLIDDMLERLGTSNCPDIGRLTDRSGRFGLAQASLGFLSNAPQPATLQKGRYVAVMDGELYDLPSIDTAYQSNGRQPEQDYAKMLAACYVNNGIQAIAGLEGSFAAAIVDSVESTVTLITDRFGTRPIYYSQPADRLCFASRISAILADETVSHELDFTGISQFFTFGHYFGNSTSLASVKLMPAGAVLVFDARQNKISIQRYWAGSDRIGTRPNSRQAAFESIDDALVASVQKRQLGAGTNVGLSLSGGLDARTILGTVDHSQTKVKTVCLGMRGSQDHKASTRLAHIVDCPHVNHILDTRFLSDFGAHLENMVRLTDGQYLSQCIVMPTLPLYRQLGIGILLRGHAGEFMHMSKAYNYSIDAEALAIKHKVGLESWLWRQLQAYLQEGVDAALFASPELGEYPARESLRQALADTPDTESPIDRVAHLFLDQRIRRETMLSLMKFRSVVEPRLPYLDRQLVERLLAIPVEWRLDDEIQAYILRKHQPAFCHVPNTNTGTRLGAGKTRRGFAQFKMKVLGKLGLPGYQPYERLGLWLRRELAEPVKTILLSEACLDRGLFNSDAIRNVVRRHLSGQRNHTYLIMALMVFEVGHRWLLDSERASVPNDTESESAGWTGTGTLKIATK